ncbi:hypothetical protein FB565_003625 [Actinoplanes lutulentus]|uniref:hypothetical protein n=1 Tax=Actinoplanes lutulentus TaxID=1287878 RepID=UPI000DB9BEEE|nr:hypothetical protein [Actinoplanes lutulentus]MBB2943896.1 hypothetical protein [Actinoplanes lutulentus]
MLFVFSFLASGALYVFGLFLTGEGFLPFGGALTLGALLAYVLTWRRPHPALVTGLALLAAGVGLVEARTGATADLTSGDGLLGLIELGLLTGGVAALALAVLKQAQSRGPARPSPAKNNPAQPSPPKNNPPKNSAAENNPPKNNPPNSGPSKHPAAGFIAAGVFGATVVMFGAEQVVNVYVGPGEIPPNIGNRASLLLIPAGVLILAGFAINAAVLRRGPLLAAAAGLVPLALLVVGAMSSAGGNDLVSAQPGPPDIRQWELHVDAYRYGVDTFETIAADSDGAYTTYAYVDVDSAPNRWDRFWSALGATLLLLGVALVVSALRRPDSRFGITLYSYRDGG